MAGSSSTGYSGTPLAKKLGIAESSHIFSAAAPSNYLQLLGPLPPGVVFESKASASTDIAHIFVVRAAELARQLPVLRKKLNPSATVWVSWPKKSSKVATDITENTIRELALPIGFVDVKVCAVTEVWSGLKLVVRKALRRECVTRARVRIISSKSAGRNTMPRQGSTILGATG